ncbi:MAG: hypothetical protein M9894_10455 [Planctomycetes bacterium]|nr:hypothetical protein [Planctomycetota bacterium]
MTEGSGSRSSLAVTAKLTRVPSGASRATTIGPGTVSVGAVTSAARRLACTRGAAGGRRVSDRPPALTVNGAAPATVLHV